MSQSLRSASDWFEKGSHLTIQKLFERNFKFCTTFVSYRFAQTGEFLTKKYLQAIFIFSRNSCHKQLTRMILRVNI